MDRVLRSKKRKKNTTGVCVPVGEATPAQADIQKSTADDSPLRLVAIQKGLVEETAPAPASLQLQKAAVDDAATAHTDVQKASVNDAAPAPADVQKASVCSVAPTPADVQKTSVDDAAPTLADVQKVSVDDAADLIKPSVDNAALVPADVHEAPVEDAALVAADVNKAPVEDAALLPADVNKAPVEDAALVSADVNKAPVEDAALLPADVHEAPIEDEIIINQTLTADDEFQGGTLAPNDKATADTPVAQFPKTHEEITSVSSEDHDIVLLSSPITKKSDVISSYTQTAEGTIKPHRTADQEVGESWKDPMRGKLSSTTTPNGFVIMSQVVTWVTLVVGLVFVYQKKDPELNNFMSVMKQQCLTLNVSNETECFIMLTNQTSSNKTVCPNNTNSTSNDTLNSLYTGFELLKQERSETDKQLQTAINKQNLQTQRMKEMQENVQFTSEVMHKLRARTQHMKRLQRKSNSENRKLNIKMSVVEKALKEKESSLEILQNKISQQGHGMEAMSKEQKNVKTELTGVTTLSGENNVKIEKLVRKVYTGSSEQAFVDTSVGFLIVVVLGLGEMVLFLLFCRRYGPAVKRHRQVPKTYTANPIDTMESYSNQNDDVLDSITQRPLHDGICCVGFYAESKLCRMSLLESLLNGNQALTGIVVKTFIVERRNDVIDMPAMKVIVVCVDYNERNNILEREEDGQGDKHVTTVKAAKKMGAEVLLLYVNDRQSDRLPDQRRFRSTLSDALKHPNICELDREGRFFTVYKQFSQYQLERCKQLLRRMLKKNQ